MQSSNPVSVKVLPCKIEFTGPVNTNEYLPSENIGSLYGRKLNGNTVSLPSDFSGFAASGTENLYTIGKFSEIQYWNWDYAPSESDQVPQLLSHLLIMKKLSE